MPLLQYNDLSFIEIGEDGALRILGVQEMDGGEYTCMATNQAGSVSAKVTLNVGCKAFSQTFEASSVFSASSPEEYLQAAVCWMRC